MAETPVVFVSWSGSEAHEIAKRLAKFICSVLPTARLFLSSTNIEAGQPWFGEVAGALDQCSAGVAIVTPQNKTKPWLYFEAGAIAKRVGESRMIPLLCGVPIGDLKDTPLTHFQSKPLAEGGIFEIVQMVRNVHDFAVADDQLRELFDTWWAKSGPALTDAAQWSASGEPAAPLVTLDDVAAGLQQLSASVRAVEQAVASAAMRTAPAVSAQGPFATTTARETVRQLNQVLDTPLVLRPTAFSAATARTGVSQDASEAATRAAADAALATNISALGHSRAARETRE